MSRCTFDPEPSGRPRGRGATGNPVNRFAKLHYEADPSDEPSTQRDQVVTEILEDDARTIIARNQSPDVGFEVSVNPYRGCEHGCAYCYARPTHEFLGFSAGLDFESKILVKRRAPDLLAAELSAPSWRPQTLTLSGVTDCYQPVEAKLGLTRACLEVLARFRNPVFVITKNQLVTRDADLLTELAAHKAVAVTLSLTTLDLDLARKLEPRASAPAARLRAVERLRASGIPVGINLAPVMPGLNDHEIPALLAAAAAAGATFAGMTMVRLPLAVAPLFTQWLEKHFPERKNRVLDQIRSMRDGKLNVSEFGERMRGNGPLAQQLHRMFEVSSRRAGLAHDAPRLNAGAFRRVMAGQLELKF
ncbi:MAG TPA: PA0069 family radical SAM protein [Chthoniobacterales bacterium]